jgi:ABC-type phosphate transport system substrate-binding protein
MGQINIFTILLFLFVSSGAALPAEIFVLANKDVPDKALERESIERIYLGKKSQWSDGTRIVPVVLKSGATHTAFVKKFLDRDASQFSTYWKQAVFTGRGMPPKAFETEAELIEFVSETPGAIGYASFVPSTKPVSRIAVK